MRRRRTTEHEKFEFKCLFSDDGGHGMIFKRFDGQLMLVLHQPNKRPNERGRLFELEDTGEALRIKSPFPKTS